MKNYNIVYRVKSDNFDGYLSAVAYRQLCLSMSSGDFGCHSKQRFELSNFNLGQKLRTEKLTYVELFDEEWEPTSLCSEYQAISEALTFKQYSKIMGGSMRYLDKLPEIRKITRAKWIHEKIDFLLSVFSQKGYIADDIIESNLC